MIPLRFTACLALVTLVSHGVFAFQDYTLSKGQTVYVSVYSNIFTAPKAAPFHLESTLIMRNTDMKSSLTLSTVDFYDTQGTLLKRYVESPIVVGPLETKYFFLPDAKGGLGANFIVRWSAESEINAPIVECLTVGTTSGQGISFVSGGRVIKEVVR